MHPKLMVSWNLTRLAADLAAHLESLDRDDYSWDTATASDEFLEPYNLSPEDDRTVCFLAWGKQCVDCGDVRDYYMVYDHVWKAAKLAPNQCCCCRCLSARLGRPLQQSDFTHSKVNTWDRVFSVSLSFAEREKTMPDAQAREFLKRLDELEQTDPKKAGAIWRHIIDTFTTALDSGALDPARGDTFEMRRLKLQAQSINNLFEKASRR